MGGSCGKKDIKDRRQLNGSIREAKMKVKELKEKLSQIKDDEEIYIKANITDRYKNTDILFITFDDLEKEEGKYYLTLKEIIEVEK